MRDESGKWVIYDATTIIFGAKSTGKASRKGS